MFLFLTFTALIVRGQFTKCVKVSNDLSSLLHRWQNSATDFDGSSSFIWSPLPYLPLIHAAHLWYACLLISSSHGNQTRAIQPDDNRAGERGDLVDVPGEQREARAASTMVQRRCAHRERRGHSCCNEWTRQNRKRHEHFQVDSASVGEWEANLLHGNASRSTRGPIKIRDSPHGWMWVVFICLPNRTAKLSTNWKGNLTPSSPFSRKN